MRGRKKRSAAVNGNGDKKKKNYDHRGKLGHWSTAEVNKWERGEIENQHNLEIFFLSFMERFYGNIRKISVFVDVRRSQGIK